MPVSTVDTKASALQGIDLSLHRITELLQRLSSPQAKFPVIHVAGTNSKGSTIAYLSSILENSIGITTGSFTSPHLRVERDCCKVGGQIIDASIWEEAGRRVREANTTAPSLSSSASASSSLDWPLNSSPFELLTARCFVAFDLLPPLQRPDLLLIEVGMGGALDATNVFSPSQVMASVICPIDYDHQVFLGNTLSEIANQKGGIIKSGGMCILADQRKQGSDANDNQVDCTKVKAVNEATLHIDGREAVEIQDTIRQKCTSLNARLVKAFVPWQALSNGISQVRDAQAPWAALATTNVRYTPVLSLSKLHPGDYVSSAGDPVVPGPSLQLPRTRAALTGCHLALQTLWSIARDETPCALGEPGSDSNEELRLRIAYGLRDDRFAKVQLQSCIQNTHIAGRAEWVNLELREKAADTMQVEGNDDEKVAAPLHLHALVDGAHNPSAALALHEYVRECIRQRIRSSKEDHSSAIHQVTVTWIVAFSQGKDVSEIIQGLTGQAESGVQGLTSSFGSLFDVHIEHKVACLPFTTPVEGMPWVTSIPAQEVAAAFQRHSLPFVEVQTFEKLEDALFWAAKEGNGRTVTDNKSNVVIIAGSLYLVSDVHRLLAHLISSAAVR